MQFPNIDPVALSIGPFDLRWYALAYIVGLVLGWRWMVWLIRRERLWSPGQPSLSVPQADDFLFWATLGVIFGGRFGYVLFYMLPSAAERAKLFDDPLSMIRLWEGGMSFHGGLIGVALAAWWFTRQKHVNEEQFAALAKKHAVAEPPADTRGEYAKVSGLGYVKKKEIADARAKAKTDTVDLLRLGDLAACAAPLGLFFGRIANFINGELWGRTTDGPFGIIFCNERIINTMGGCPAGLEPRHPSQLYEAFLEGIVLFVAINIATLRFDSLRRPGLNTGVFLVLYGLFRALLETVREPDQHMPEALQGYVTMGMLLSIPMILAGAWLINRAFKQPKLATA